MAAADESTAPYVVQGKRRNGLVTYHCPDAGWALRKLRDFVRADYTAITVKAPDGRRLGEAELTALCDAHKASVAAET